MALNKEIMKNSQDSKTHYFVQDALIAN